MRKRDLLLGYLIYRAGKSAGEAEREEPQTRHSPQRYSGPQQTGCLGIMIPVIIGLIIGILITSVTE